MTRPAEPLTIEAEDGQVWAPAAADEGTAPLAVCCELPLAREEVRLVRLRDLRAWLDREMKRARDASQLSFFVRRRQWFSRVVVGISSALPVGTVRLRIRGGRLYRDWALLAVPEGMPVAVRPPGARNDDAGSHARGVGRKFSFPPDEAPVCLEGPVEMVTCRGSGEHWFREIERPVFRVFSGG